MKNVSLNVTVPPDRRLVVQLPDDVEPGDVRLLVIQGPKGRVKKSDDDALAWLPQLHLTSWPEDFPLRREDMYGDDGR
ncbi:MAG TPA: hypothetical protein PKE31_08845 [Pseudomonadota bacterium]|nr:hypothetical protein [Pseudomonadota bacterium]